MQQSQLGLGLTWALPYTPGLQIQLEASCGSKMSPAIPLQLLGCCWSYYA